MVATDSDAGKIAAVDNGGPHHMIAIENARRMLRQHESFSVMPHRILPIIDQAVAVLHPGEPQLPVFVDALELGQTLGQSPSDVADAFSWLEEFELADVQRQGWQFTLRLRPLMLQSLGFH